MNDQYNPIKMQLINNVKIEYAFILFFGGDEIEMSKADSTHGQDDKCITTVDEKREGIRPHGQLQRT
jgi:hypothetical protein